MNENTEKRENDLLQNKKQDNKKIMYSGEELSKKLKTNCRFQVSWMLVACWIVLIGVFLFLRCFRINILPIFGDEALYLHWARMIQKSSADMFISLCDKKAPFYFILTSIFYSVNYPLIVGRCVAVGCALLSLVLIYAICNSSISKRAGWYGAVLYIFSYFFFQNDRQVNPEVLVGTLTLAVIWASIRFIQTEKQIWGIVAGFFMGLGVFTKLSMYAIWPIPVFLLILRGEHKKSLQLWSCYLIALLFPVVTLLAPQKQVFASHSHFLKLSDLITFPVDVWRHNIGMFSGITTIYIGWPILILMLAGLYFAFKHKNRYILGIGIFAFSLIILMIFISKGKMYPRYFPMPLSAAIIPAAFALDWIRGHYLRKAWLFLLLFIAINLQGAWSMFAFFKNPIDAPWCPMDKFQFFHGTFSGTGVKELEEFLTKQASKQGIHVFIPRNMGPPLDPLTIELEKNKNIIIIPTSWFTKSAILNKKETFFLPKSPFQLHKPGNEVISYEQGRFLYVKKLNGDMSHSDQSDVYMNIPIRRAYFVASEYRFPMQIFEHLNPRALKVFEYEKPGNNPNMKYYIYSLPTK